MTRKPSLSLVPMLQQRLNAPASVQTEKLSTYGVILSFAGIVDSAAISPLIQLSESSLLYTGASRKEIKRAMSVLIEVVQNVIHHGHIDDDGECSLFLTLEHTPVGIQVHCGNFMDDLSAHHLGERVANLNNLTHAELRKMYIDVLCEGEQHPNRGNAGLGLISIAKRSEGPIEYRFDSHSNGLMLVTLTSTIRR